jgi:hypothetical protein
MATIAAQAFEREPVKRDRVDLSTCRERHRQTILSRDQADSFANQHRVNHSEPASRKLAERERAERAAEAELEAELDKAAQSGRPVKGLGDLREQVEVCKRATSIARNDLSIAEAKANEIGQSAQACHLAVRMSAMAVFSEDVDGDLTALSNTLRLAATIRERLVAKSHVCFAELNRTSDPAPMRNGWNAIGRKIDEGLNRGIEQLPIDEKTKRRARGYLEELIASASAQW